MLLAYVLVCLFVIWRILNKLPQGLALRKDTPYLLFKNCFANSSSLVGSLLFPESQLCLDPLSFEVPFKIRCQTDAVFRWTFAAVWVTRGIHQGWAIIGVKPGPRTKKKNTMFVQRGGCCLALHLFCGPIQKLIWTPTTTGQGRIERAP